MRRSSKRSSKESSSSFESEHGSRGNSKGGHADNAEVSENTAEESNQTGCKNYFHFRNDIAGTMPKWSVVLKDRETIRWGAVDADAKKRCIQAIVRLLIIRGAKNEQITRSRLLDEISLIDPLLKSHINAILMEAQSILYKNFGQRFCTGADLNTTNTISETAKEKIYVYNAMRSPQLLQILSHHSPSAAFHGFCVGIFISIWTSVGKKQTASTLIKQLRLLDRRFPETLNSSVASSNNKRGRERERESEREKKMSSSQKERKSQREREREGESDDDEEDGKRKKESEREREVQEREGANYAIPELNGNFYQLMSRMVKEGYLLVENDREKGGRERDDDAKTTYILGPRFYAEMGIRGLITSYFQGKSEPLDNTLLQDITEEERRARERSVTAA